jgi:hypothetical protein
MSQRAMKFDLSVYVNILCGEQILVTLAIFEQY